MIRWLFLPLVAVFIAQLGLGQIVKTIPKVWEVVPAPPTARGMQLASFGDQQLLYRVFARQVQEFGDNAGRSTRMVDYDMGKVVLWLDVLDQLDLRAQYQLALALRYFASTPNKEHLALLVDYASRAVDLNPINRAQWLRDAIDVADRKLKNPALAMKVADQLASVDWPDLNILAHQLGPLLHAKYGDFAGALTGMKLAMTKVKPATPQSEVDFMAKFIAEMEQRVASPTTPNLPPGSR